ALLRSPVREYSNMAASKRKLIAMALLIDESLDCDHAPAKQPRPWAREWLLQKERAIQNTLVPDLRLTDPKAYRELLRMDEGTFEELLGLVRPLIKKEDTNMRESIKPDTRLELTLRFLATGESQKSLAYQFRLGHGTVHAILWETCAAICTTLGHLVHTPATEEEWLAKAEDFKMIWQFPNCVAAIDGKHVQIVKPARSGSLYYNYKKTFSLVLFALTDARYNFIYVDASSYGSASDGGVWARTPLGKQVARGSAHLPRTVALPNSPLQLPAVIVGDDAFPLAEHLMKPHSKSNLTDEEATFNERLSRSRRVVENSFGQLANRFRVYHTTIYAEPDHVRDLIKATCILHNLLKRGSSPPLQTTSDKPKTTSKLLPLGACGARYGATAAFIRNELTNYFSTVGALP
ncbi:unnamed protein product, partial [Ixodes persulcatus]